MRQSRSLLPFLLVAASACTSSEPTFPTGSQTIVAAADGHDAYVVDMDTQAVVHDAAVTRAAIATPLDAVPGRITRSGDSVWVTLPQDRGIAVLDASGGSLDRVGTLATGAAPLGIVASPDGDRLYVAMTTGNEVDELSTDGDVLRTWQVADQPSWLAIRPQGDGLYVGSALGGTITWIDLDSDEVTELSLPAVRNSSNDPLTRRVTGDPWVSADGTILAVPCLYVDNFTPAPPAQRTAYYGEGSGDGIARFNPTVALIPLGDGGIASSESASIVLLAAPGTDGNYVRSYPSSVTLAPDGTWGLATMEASSAVVAFSTSAMGHAGLASSALAVIGTDAGPRGVAFTGGLSARVDNFIARTTSDVPAAIDSYLGEDYSEAMDASGGRDLGDSPLDRQILAGRARFYSATDPVMAASSSGVSCSTCHFGGRSDGLTWRLEVGNRQTPSLAGGISSAAPFTWSSDVDTVADEVHITSQDRMGGDGLTDDEADGIAAYIETIPAPDEPELGWTSDAVERGRAIFDRADVACASCHSGAMYTDNGYWNVAGLTANTPSLRRVATTAPYFHDGRADTLRDVIEAGADGSMGDTSMLSESEKDDLEAYLRSL